MKDKNIFDILENAENDSMDRIIDKCPEISDEQLDKILKMSERKYNMKKNNIKGTMRDNIEMTSNDVVEGVERIKRPKWLAPLSTAASLILIAGLAVGSAVIFNHRTPVVDDNYIAPAASVTTVSSGTTAVSTDKNGTTANETVTSDSTVTSAVETENTKDFIIPFAGTWTYQVSNGNYTVDQEAAFGGTVEIFENSTYKFTDRDGNIETGSIVSDEDEIGGTKIKYLHFTSDTTNSASAEPRFVGSYDENDLNVINIGNGGMARLVRGVQNGKSGKITTGVTAYGLVGKWSAKENDYSNNYIGLLNIEANGFYTYTDADGNVSTGTVDANGKEHSDAVYVTFLDGSEVKHPGYYDAPSDMICLTDNGYCFIRGEHPLGNSDANKDVSGIDITKLAGNWIYELSDGGNGAEEVMSNNGTVYIRADGTYTYHDPDYNITNGTVTIGTEEIEDTKLVTVGFYIDNEYQFGGYYRENEPNIISIGNGGMARLVKMN